MNNCYEQILVFSHEESAGRKKYHLNSDPPKRIQQTSYHSYTLTLALLFNVLYIFLLLYVSILLLLLVVLWHLSQWNPHLEMLHGNLGESFQNLHQQCSWRLEYNDTSSCIVCWGFSSWKWVFGTWKLRLTGSIERVRSIWAPQDLSLLTMVNVGGPSGC